MKPFPGAEVALVRTLWYIFQAWYNRSPGFEEKTVSQLIRPVFSDVRDWWAFDTGLVGYHRLSEAWSKAARWSPRQRWLYRLGLQFDEQWRQWERQARTSRSAEFRLPCRSQCESGRAEHRGGSPACGPRSPERIGQ